MTFLVRRLPQRIPAKLILVFVSNRLDWPDHLDPRVKSFLKINELIFKPYDAVDLQHILRIRVEKALRPECVEPGVIEKIAALGLEFLDLFEQDLEVQALQPDRCQRGIDGLEPVGDVLAVAGQQVQGIGLGLMFGPGIMPFLGVLVGVTHGPLEHRIGQPVRKPRHRPILAK